MKKGDLLFVYGTLRCGENADLSKPEHQGAIEYLGEDQLNGSIYMATDWFPGAKASPGHFDPGQPAITGDVFKILDAALVPFLDGYEGYPSLYDRIETETASGRHVWIYTYNRDMPEERLIASGDWKSRFATGPQSVQPVAASGTPNSAAA